MTIDAGILWRRSPRAPRHGDPPPLACRCINRGIVFIDLAVAQIAGLE
jgi:hypothetical protein